MLKRCALKKYLHSITVNRKIFFLIKTLSHCIIIITFRSYVHRFVLLVFIRETLLHVFMILKNADNNFIICKRSTKTPFLNNKIKIFQTKNLNISKHVFTTNCIKELFKCLSRLTPHSTINAINLPI